MSFSKNIAVIGTGYWGKNLVRNFHNLGALHTVCDIDTAAVKKFCKQYSGISGTTVYSDILNNSDIAGITISTPAETHFDLAREAILAGKDVYVEKPLCLSEKEGQELNDLADTHERILMIGHLLWYHPAVLKLKQLIHEGKIGRIQYIYSNRLNLGKLRREENVLWSFAPHDISVILGLIDEMPESVRAQGSNLLHQKIADTTVTLLNFPSGIKAHIFVSWLHPFKEQKLVVVGDKQMAVFDDTAPWNEKLLLYPHSVEWNDNIPVAHKAEAIPVKLKEKEPLKAECLHFLECIHKRQAPRTDGQEGLRVLKVLNACQSSLQQEKQRTLTQTGSRKKDYFVHDTALLDSNVTVGDNSKIWHFSHLLSGTTLGRQCNVGQNVSIGPNVTIGDNCKIQNNVSVYEGVTLEDNVFCGPSMVFTNVYNPRCEFSRKNNLQKTLVKEGATLGANCTIVCGITIGKHAFIGAGAVITRDVPDFALMIGNPARQSGWMSRFGEQLELPKEEKGECVCPHTKERYKLCDGALQIIQE